MKYIKAFKIKDKYGFWYKLEFHLSFHKQPCLHWETLKPITYEEPVLLIETYRRSFKGGRYSKYSHFHPITLMQKLMKYPDTAWRGGTKEELQEILHLYNQLVRHSHYYGTKRQMELIQQAKIPDNIRYLKQIQDVLKQHNLYVDRGYEFGKHHFCNPLPPEIKERLITLFTRGKDNGKKKTQKEKKND